MRPTIAGRLAHGVREGAAGQPRVRRSTRTTAATDPAAEVFVGGATRSVQGTARAADARRGATWPRRTTGRRSGCTSTAPRSRSSPSSGSILTSNSPLRIGGNSIWGEYFNGLIDEVRVYNRALTAAEIQNDMIRSITPDVTPPTITARTPATGSAGVNVGTSPTATFSELDELRHDQRRRTFQLKDASERRRFRRPSRTTRRRTWRR